MAKKKQNRKDLRKKLITLAIFLVKLNLLAVPLYAIIYYNISFEPLQNIIASISFYLLKIFGYGFALDGHTLYTFSGDNFIQVNISWDSAGWKSLYILSALVVATPAAAWKRKIGFLVWALPAMFAINIARITTTIIASLSYGPENFGKIFDFLHLFLWSSVSIATVIGLWYVFLKTEKDNIREK